MCVDVYPTVHERFGSPSGLYDLTHVRFNTGTSYPNFWIDEFSITTTETSGKKREREREREGGREGGREGEKEERVYLNYI